MFGATLALAVVVLGPPPSPDPTALVGLLGSPRYAQRESAEEGLARLGRAALPALRAARDAKDPEIRTRASALLSRIEGALLLQPTPVALDFRDVPIGEAIRSINGQAGLNLMLSPEGDPAWKGRRLTLRADEPLPFWKAIDALCEAGQLHYVHGTQAPLGHRETAFPLYDGVATGSGPTWDSGPFRVHLASVQYQSEIQFGQARPEQVARGGMPPSPDDPGRPATTASKQFYVQLLVAAEPRLSITQNGAIRLTTAVDDRERSLLLPPGLGSFQQNSGYYGINPSPLVRVRGDLSHPDDAGKRIRLLRGSIPVIVATRKPDPLEVSLANSVGKTSRKDDVALTVRDSRPSRDGQPTTIELTIRHQGPTSQPLDAGEGEPLPYRPESPQQQIEILDARGQTLPWFPSAVSYYGEETRLTLSLVNRGVPAVPATLRYHGIMRAESEVTFEFRDVPMP